MKKALCMALLAGAIASGQEAKDEDPDWEEAARINGRIQTEWKARGARLGMDVASLWGLPGVTLGADVDAGIAEAGLGEEALLKAVRERLEAHRVPALSREAAAEHPAGPSLSARVRLRQKDGRFTGAVSLFCAQFAEVPGPNPYGQKFAEGELAFLECSGLDTYAITWETGEIAADCTAAEVRALVAKCVDRFGDAFGRANAE